MTPAPIRSSRPDHWTHPRWRDRASDHYRHGPLLPMQPERRGLLQRIKECFV